MDGVEVLHVMTGTPVCSNRCAFCIDRSRGPEKTIDLAGAIAELERARPRTDEVCFTAGEPTLNPILPDAIAAARERGYKAVGIVSNGRRFRDPEFCERLLDAGLNGVIISLHGPDAASHDACTRRPGSFKQSVLGLENLTRLRREREFSLVVSCVVTKLNLGVMKEMAAFCSRFALDNLNFNVVEPRGRADDEFEAVVPRYSDVLRAAHESGLDFREKSVSLSRVPACAGGPDWTQETWLVVSGPETRAYSPAEGRLHGPPCASCAARACPGVWESYVRRYGWDEFAPVSPPEPLAGQTLLVREGEPVSAALRVGYLRGWRRVELEVGGDARDARWPGWLREARDLGYEWIGVAALYSPAAAPDELRATARAAALLAREAGASAARLAVASRRD